MNERSVPDFHDALLCEAIITLQKMSEGARVQAQALEAQASMVEQLVDASRRYRGHPMTPVEIPGEPATMVYATPGVTEVRRRFRHGDIETGREAVNRVRRAMGGSPIPASDMPFPLRESPVHRTREGREVGPLSPLDEPKAQAEWTPSTEQERRDYERFTDAPAEALEAEVIADVMPEIEIVEKVLEPVPSDTTLDASGKLIPAEPEKPLVDVQAVLRQQEEEILRGQAEAKEQGDMGEDLAKGWTTPAEITRDEEVLIMPEPAPQPDPRYQQIAPEAFSSQAETISTIEPPLQPDPAPEPETKPRAGKKSFRPAVGTVSSLKDRILDRFAATGEEHHKIAHELGITSSTVALYLAQGRQEGDKRAAQGDIKRNDSETAQEDVLRKEFTKEATTKRDLVFFDDELLGSPAYRVDYGLKQIETPHGDLPFNPAWLRIFDILKDRHEHDSDSVWKAARFANERMLLSNLRSVNEQLAKVKLYILADSRHYQICGLL